MKSFQPKNRKEWREWLKKNHAKEKEICLVYYKKHIAKPTITYMDSVEEAICFGWIDGIKKRIDDEKYSHRFTVRKEKSKWSPLNIRLAEKMIEEKKMTRFGRTFFEKRVVYALDLLKVSASNEIILTPAIEQALKNNEKAWRNFLKLAPSHKKQYVGWITSAKKELTKRKRLKEAIQLLAQNSKLGMK